MRAPLALLAATPVLLTAPAHAREVDRQEVAERFDTEAEQEQRLYCRDTQVFTVEPGVSYRACVDWRAQNRTRIIRSYAALDGPEVDDAANLDIARTCFDIAVARENDPYRESFQEDIFLAAARTNFSVCAAQRSLNKADQYSLRVYETGVWLGGR